MGWYSGRSGARAGVPAILHAHHLVRKNLIEGARRNFHSGVKVEDEAIYVDEPAYRSFAKSKERTLGYRTGSESISANQSLWKWNQPVDNFGPIFEKGKSRQMGFGGGQFRGQDVDHSGGRPSTWESSLETGAREVQATRHCSERLRACAKIAQSCRRGRLRGGRCLQTKGWL